MHILIVGASGYVGAAVAELLISRGHQVSGLARNDEAAARISQAGWEIVRGNITDLAALQFRVKEFDGMLFAPVVPFEQEGPALAAAIDAFSGSGKPLVYTSGTGVLSIEARDGRWHQETFAEDDPYEARHWLSLRVDTENLVRRSVDRGVRGIVVRPPLIWGRGGSKQVPAVFESVHKTGAACYIGDGLNLYSHVHIEDLADLFVRAFEHGAPGGLYHAVAGEINWRTIAESVAEVMGCKTRSVGFAEACEIWEPLFADLFFAVSSRSRAVRSRSELGWEPTKFDLVEDIRRGSYRERYRPV